jgi:hypothetical protein
MKPLSSLYKLALLACLILATAYGQTWAAGSANITAIQVAPDLKQISIKCDGPVGRPSAFVIQQPYRLVMDLESTGLGRTPARIPIGRNPINEIRLGYTNSRARVVVDFGDNPVPSFKIDRQRDAVIVNLGIKAAAPAVGSGGKPAAHIQRAAIQPKSVVPSPSLLTVDTSTITVKTAGVKNDRVFVELAQKKDAKRTYRLVIDLDVENLQVRQATVSDAQGHSKQFELALSKSPDDTSVSLIKPIVGPRRAAGPTAAIAGGQSKFKWGIQGVESGQAGERKMNAGIPIRVERFEPRLIHPQAAAEEG